MHIARKKNKNSKGDRQEGRVIERKERENKFEYIEGSKERKMLK
jgi:hypothetical protein